MRLLIEIHIEEVIYLVSKGLVDWVTNGVGVNVIKSIDYLVLRIGVSQVF